MKDTSLYRRFGAALLAIVCVTAWACSRTDNKTEPTRNRTWQKHVPANSDIMIAADLDEMRKTQWYSENAVESRSQELAARAGFSYDDIEAFVLASDLDSMPSLESLSNIVKLDEAGNPDPAAIKASDLKGINASILLCLNKPISWQQTKAAIDVFFGSVTNATITHIQNEETIIVKQSPSPMPLTITLSEDRRVLKMNTGSNAVSSVTSSRLNQLMARDIGIAGNGPLRVVMQTSSQMRRRLQEASSEPAGPSGQQDSTAMLVGSALKPFVSFEGLAIAMTPSESATKVYGELEFGSEEHALEAEVAINNILIPLITLTLTQRSEGPIMEPILQKTSTYVRGNTLEFKATLRPQAPEETDTSSD